MYCTCGQYLIDSESRRKFNKLRLDALSIPNYVIKKGRSHGARHGKTKVQRAYHLAWKKADSLGEHFTGVHDRFLRDPVYRESQLAIGWTEQRWKELDELAKEDLSFHLTPEEKRRYQAQWFLTLNKSGKHGLMKLRSDFRAAVSLKDRLLHESGEQIEEPNSAKQYSIWHLSSSTSWWNKNYKWAHKIFFDLIFFLLQLVSFTVDGDPQWPTGGVVWLCAYSLHGSRRAKVQCVIVCVWFPLLVFVLSFSRFSPSSYLFSSALYPFFFRHSIINVDTADG